MKNLEMQMELIMISSYCDIIYKILSEHKNLTVNKIMVFSYLVKKEKYIHKNIYTAHNKNDVILKCLSQLSGVFNDYCENIRYITIAIHLLITSNRILINGTELMWPSNMAIEKWDESPFMKKAIEESKTYSDRQFLKEVMYNV